MPEKLGQENPSNKLQIQQENPAGSNSAKQTAGKSRPLTTDTAGKSCGQKQKKQPESLIIDGTETSE
jgi:hypothetical protein